MAKKEVSFGGLMTNTDKIQRKINNSKIIKVRLSDIHQVEPFKSLLHFSEERCKSQMENIDRDGFREEKAIILMVIDGKKVVVDGNHRFTAAKRLNLEYVYAVIYPFDSVTEARQYAIKEQFLDRRNSTAIDIQCAMKSKGFWEDFPEGNKKDVIASMFGIAPRAAQCHLNFLSYATPEQVDLLMSGKVTSIYNLDAELEKPEKNKNYSVAASRRESEKKNASDPISVSPSVEIETEKKESGSSSVDKVPASSPAAADPVAPPKDESPADDGAPSKEEVSAGLDELTSRASRPRPAVEGFSSHEKIIIQNVIDNFPSVSLAEAKEASEIFRKVISFSEEA